jgi:hypothetical protein
VEIARRLGMNQATVSRAIERGISAMREAFRTRGVIAGAGLAAVFAAQPAQAMPASLAASLGKLSITNIGASSAAVSATSVAASTLIAMTTTTKILIGSTAVAAVAFFFVPQPEEKKPMPQVSLTAAKSTNKVAVANTPEPKRYRPEAGSVELQQRVDEFIRKFEDLPTEVMMGSAEFEEAMRGMAVFLESPANQKMIREAVAEIKKAKQMNHGTLNIAIDTDESLGSPKNRALIEASMSQDPKKIEGWLRGALEGAIFEYSVDPDLKKPAGSISVQSADEAKLPDR